MTTAASDYPLLDVFWTMALFFLWFTFIWLLVVVFSDIFRRSDLDGWGKALWSIFVVILPFLGAFVYLLTEGRAMQDRQRSRTQMAQRYDESARQPAHDGRTTSADQIARAKQLLDSGAITPDEYATLKQKALAA